MRESSIYSPVEALRRFNWDPSRQINRTITRSELEIRQIDDDLVLMNQSYRLRYQVYCLERGFLNPANYPDRLERDEFDRVSLHAGVVNRQRQLLGTLRLVKANMVDLPLFHHCTLFDHYERELHRDGVQLAEVSRLCMSRECRDDSAANSRVGLNLYRATYQTSKRAKLTHWLVAMEPALHRLLAAVGVPFRVAGPVTDYFGPVAPYICDLQEFDEIILSGKRPRLRSFLDGLEPQYHPAAVGVV
jgi:N-acyl amino acid synthase of PEP-CTERM/exosortase system